MSKRLVLAGAGHAHLTILARLAEISGQGHQVTVVGPAPRHYYSGMGPGMLGGAYAPREISFPVRRMTQEQGGRFIQGHVESFDPHQRLLRLADGRELPYDVVSFNTGSRIPDQMVAKGSRYVYPVKPIENLLAARRRIAELGTKGPVRVAVVGGGPAALEVAGNAWAAGQEAGGQGCQVSVYAGRRFLPGLHPKVARIARQTFMQRGIEIMEGAYVEQVAEGKVTLADGRGFEHDLVFLATGVRPRPIFAASGVPVGDDGGLRVNRFLQSVAFAEVFGGGDCIWFSERPLDKVGVYAVRQNPILFSNVLAKLEDRDLTPFDPGGPYLLIFNLGGGQGILVKWGLVFGGGLAFKIKDYIDRRFIRTFKPAYDN